MLLYVFTYICFSFFNDPAATESDTYLHTLSLHDALPICPESAPILWAAQGVGGAAVRLNGVLITLGTSGDPQTGTAEFSAPGTTITVRALGEDADWRA